MSSLGRPYRVFEQRGRGAVGATVTVRLVQIINDREQGWLIAKVPRGLPMVVMVAFCLGQRLRWVGIIRASWRSDAKGVYLVGRYPRLARHRRTVTRVPTQYKTSLTLHQRTDPMRSQLGSDRL